MFPTISKTDVIFPAMFEFVVNKCFKFGRVQTLLCGNELYRCNICYSLQNGKILDWSKQKAFADDKIIMTETLQFVLERAENIVGNGENAGYLHFLLCPQCFQKASSSGSLKIGIV